MKTRSPRSAEYKLSKPELLQVKTRDGFVMEAMMIKPPDFDPSRRYPVYQFTYGGPHAQQVRNAWGGTQYMYHQLLAQNGIIVWICDNRTASGKGSESAWPLFKNLGEIELRDIEDGVSWLKQQPYVDAVTNRDPWVELRRLRDELRTDTQQELRHGHRGRHGGRLAQLRHRLHRALYGIAGRQSRRLSNSAPRFAAGDLHGALLLIHGLIDDNVHLAEHDSIGVRASKSAEAIPIDALSESLAMASPIPARQTSRSTMFAFVLEQLKPDSSTKAPATK